MKLNLFGTSWNGLVRFDLPHVAGGQILYEIEAMENEIVRIIRPVYTGKKRFASGGQERLREIGRRCKACAMNIAKFGERSPRLEAIAEAFTQKFFSMRALPYDLLTRIYGRLNETAFPPPQPDPLEEIYSQG